MRRRNHHLRSKLGHPRRTFMFPLLLCLSLISGALIGCGSATKTSKQDIRDRLRRNSGEAMSHVTGKRRHATKSTAQAKRALQGGVAQGDAIAPSEVAPAIRLPTGVTCIDQLSCFPASQYLVAEGLGATERDAEMDAIGRLAAKINSEVSSTVSLSTVEGDGVKSRTQGEVKQTIKSDFSRNHLISALNGVEIEDADAQSRFKVIAYLARGKYQDEVDRELERPIRELSATVSALITEKNPEVFVRVWGEFVRQRALTEAPLSEYRAVVGALPKSYQALKPQLVEVETQADKRRRASHFVIDLQGAEEVEQPLRALVKSLVREQGPRVSSPGTCLRGDYLLRVESGVEEGVHQLTGGGLRKLRWGVTLYECGENANLLREISQRALPSVNAVERYNASAEQVLVRQLKALSKPKLAKRGAANKRENARLQKLNAEIREGIVSLVELVVPTQ